MFVFELPEVGEGVVEGEIVKWLVTVGDQIKSDQPICEIMTDKATIEISSPKKGKVSRLHGEEGDVITVHTPLLELDLNDEDASTAAPKANVQSQTPAAAPAHSPAKTQTPQPKKNRKYPIPNTTTASNGKVLASPAVRAYANEQDVALENLIGSGRGGRISRSDIDNAQSKNGDPVSPRPMPLAPPALLAETPLRGQDKVIKIIGLRRKIAEKMVEAVRIAPHFTYVEEVDVTALVTLRKELVPIDKSQGVKLTYLPFIMKALASVFQQFPTINAVMDENAHSLVVRGEINIGVATDTPAGLYVPVVKNVEQQNILTLAKTIADLTERTRNNTIAMHELQGGTFTITSVGNIGGKFATPIIHHPEVAILGVNQIHDRPMVVNGEIVARKMMYLSPSFDHRIIDGAVAARFVAALKLILENPQRLLLELR